MDKLEIVDARGLSCPQPVILTKRELEKQGGKAIVMVDNDVAVDNIARFAESRGLSFSVKEDGENYIIAIGQE